MVNKIQQQKKSKDKLPLKDGNVLAGTCTGSPVLGFLATRSFAYLGLNVPNPVRTTLLKHDKLS